MGPTRRRPFGDACLAAGVALALTLTASACAVTTPAADPFQGAGGGDSPRGSIRSQRVTLEVLCGHCSVSYSVAGRITSVPSAGPRWGVSFVRYPGFPEAIRVIASGGEYIDRARIWVNGDLVASDENDERAAAVVVETVIPVQPQMPDTSRALDSEGPPERR